MNNNYANVKISTLKAGAFFKMSYVSDVPLSAKGKKEGVYVFKRTIGTYRTGIAYKNTKKAKITFEAKGGKIEDNTKLPWGHWKDDSCRIICHTNKIGEYKEYIRVYDTPNKPKIQYYINSTPVTRAQLIASGYVPNSYFNKPVGSGCYNICLNNIEWIGRPVQ
jgi:hypothetical protein